MSDDVPFYLMPVAAIFGTYAVLGGFRLVHLIYKNLSSKESTTATTSSSSTPSLSSRSFWFLLLTVVASVLAYGRVVASVNHALASSSRHSMHFDPYELLQLPSGATNTTQIKQAYRRLSKIHHPDKQQQQQQKNNDNGNQDLFHQIHLAYKALTDDTAKRNYQQYGHPDGPLTSPSLDFALPEWLLHPQGNVALILVLLYLGLFVALILFVLQWAKQSNGTDNDSSVDDEKTVNVRDMTYMSKHLRPTSTHFDVLLAIATCPENIRLANRALDKIEIIKAERIVQAEAKKKTTNVTLDLDKLVGDDGWAADDEDDEGTTQKAKEEEERKKKEREQLQEAIGKNVLLEGIDEGVIGQKWVEATLTQAKQWPPPNLGFVEPMKFDYKGKKMSAMDHPGVRRNLCMTMGRLNSILLNGNVHLLEAGSTGLLDHTYFRAGQEYRQRVSMLLEAALRLATSAKTFRLAKTIVETIAMFKIGVSSATDPKKVDWFINVMKSQYMGDEGVPKLMVHDMTYSTPGEDEIANGDLCTVELDLERLHSENFTKKKLAICQKQGIMPEAVLRSYREGWWILVRAKKIDGSPDERAESTEENPLLQFVEQRDLEELSDETPENRLLTAWPMMVANATEKRGKVRVQFKAPDTPGKYCFYVEIKSQEFLGADQVLTQNLQLVDVDELRRHEAEEENGDDDETKKEQ